MKTSELRKKYLDFFINKGHKYIASDTLVPDDESVLFTSAGMNQFKPYYFGEKDDIKTATSCQKCLRTGDIEEVGKTLFHHTFFEMLGNFSFGDYFKREAILYAWEFLTKELNINETKLWVSVYKEDEEAYSIWTETVGVPIERTVRLGDKSNFWPANAPKDGPNGPCGPCSEIFFDRGDNVGCGNKNCNPDCDCGRFVEIWNLVFIQYNRVDEAKLNELPQKNIDTGMGLERMASVLQGKESNFDIDIFAPAVAAVKKLFSINGEDNRSYVNAIVDHARAAMFSISDGVYPSNEGRGYVIRKIIRRALSFAVILGRQKPFLYTLPNFFIETMSDVYPEIKIKNEVISKVIKSEEESYFTTYKEGKKKLTAIAKEASRAADKQISAQDIFVLYDTYGLSFDTAKLVADELGVKVDISGAKNILKDQQAQSRKKSMFEDNIFSQRDINIDIKSDFVGYSDHDIKANVIHIVLNGIESGEINNDKEAILVLDKTPFYSESGGQLSDKGIIFSDKGKFSVENVTRSGDVILHHGRLLEGTLAKGKVMARIDIHRRQALARAHTATHLLQSVLRKVLGDHVSQQGSFLDEDKLRFDFTHFKGLAESELSAIEKKVNELVMNDGAVCVNEMSLDEAKQKGALAFFKDKYSQKVRLVNIDDYSKELCGGTHVEKTSQIGFFVLLRESSISSGVRRIEAVVGREAYNYFLGLRNKISKISGMLKVPEVSVIDSVVRLQSELITVNERIKSFESKELELYSETVLSDGEKIDDLDFIFANFQDKDYPALLYFNDIIRRKKGNYIIFLNSSFQGRNIFLFGVSSDLANKDLNAKSLMGYFKDKLPLKGGGNLNTAQGVVIGECKGLKEKVKGCIIDFLKGES
ncbi:MAG: alanine--tRNA ligase [Candidatus Omnitrophica bacterium]|nr:alanine--tRNA ligase [Candidatus Omnitrophota bacterium]